MNGIFILRLVITAIALTLGIVLIARGNVLIGGLICVLAVARLTMFVSMRKRRREFRERFPHQGNQDQGGNDPWN